MLLAVDIGNSQTSFGLFDGERLRVHWRLETVPQRTSDEYASFLLPLLQLSQIPLDQIQQVAVASVVPNAERSFHGFCQRYLEREPCKISWRSNLGFQLGVDVPAEVGADRLANAAYAVERLKLPAIVVDLGTATTFDIISKGGVYEGGMILPGVRLCIQALSQNTAKLTSVEVKFPPALIGKNTVDCIQSGVLNGYCDLLDGLLGRLTGELGECSVVFTGGLSALFQERIKTPFRWHPDLTLDGIRLLHDRN